MKEKIELNAEAICLRKQFGEDANSPVDIFALLHQSEDLTIVFYPMGERVSGICIRDGNNKIIGVNSTFTQGRQRFTAAHELYHLFFHEEFKSIVCSKDLEMEKDTSEKEADVFASFFLAPYEALAHFVKHKLGRDRGSLELDDVIRIEQFFGLSRQAILWRLIDDGYLTRKKADMMKRGVIASALRLGFDSKLYLPSPKEKQYITFGKYINLIEQLKDRELVSRGKYEELLLDGFRGDIVYGLGVQKEEQYD
ncbi:MAG: ImmA/IrrE family metallo-endopeptidase [Dethiobacteria bacterium]|jgi:Zn-dependent peptidase ImmA (M78 family)